MCKRGLRKIKSRKVKNTHVTESINISNSKVSSVDISMLSICERIINISFINVTIEMFISI